ncbi:TAXI family TRAP transporter solute-binding subunit [Rhodoplanes sp. Z2-YC6860]|uniref:TAXI family TRAP transporter solute-binding subunit n=1 Tax=Rhodoplanes sp. Z2-YC6860 TaxID=674703 RepID=UPI00078C4066|nr:TAXI family TRAP transporter solute-binding subunit [Rhodoplanes sp. Z2-YC6860]AMN38885.1 TRAP transporter solute receptor TAXI family protein [Rhodoplanes sp. Z2-YC6860]
MQVRLRRLFRAANPPTAVPASGDARDGWGRHFRLMMQHTGLIIMAFVLLCGGVAAFAYHHSMQPTELKIAVGPPNSDDARIIQAFAAQFARDRLNTRLNVTVVPGGPLEAANALDKGQADLAVVRRDVAMPKNGQAIAILRKNVVAFIVPSAPDPAKGAKGKSAGKSAAKIKPVEKIEQFVGRRIGIVGRSPRNLDLLKAILHQYNINPDKVVMLGSDDLGKPNAPDRVSVIQFDPSNVAQSIRDSAVDVIMSVGPVGSKITADAISAATRGKEPPTFLAISAAEAIAERNPVYESSEIKAGAFGGSPPRPEESVDTIEVQYFIVARKLLSEQVAADLTKNLLASRQAIAAEIPAAAKIEKPDTDKDASVPVHPGAAAYLDGELKSFFDRYNDWIYLGLMVVSFLGSGFAGLLSYNKADDRVRRLRSLERLLEIAKAARTAETNQTLDELQDEIDAIQDEMIRAVEASTLDDTAIAAYSLSIDRAQTAISERRSALSGQAPRPLAAVAAL